KQLDESSCLTLLEHRFARIAPTRGVGLKDRAQDIPNLAKFFKLLIFCPFRLRWVEKGPAVSIGLPREDRADIFRLATDCDHGLNRLIQKFAHGLGSVV